VFISKQSSLTLVEAVMLGFFAVPTLSLDGRIILLSAIG